MCQSMVDIQPAAAEIRRGKKKKIDGKKLQGKNIMAPLLRRAAISSNFRPISCYISETIQDTDTATVKR